MAGEAQVEDAVALLSGPRALTLEQNSLFSTAPGLGSFPHTLRAGVPGSSVSQALQLCMFFARRSVILIQSQFQSILAGWPRANTQLSKSCLVLSYGFLSEHFRPRCAGLQPSFQGHVGSSSLASSFPRFKQLLRGHGVNPGPLLHCQPSARRPCLFGPCRPFLRSCGKNTSSILRRLQADFARVSTSLFRRERVKSGFLVSRFVPVGPRACRHGRPRSMLQCFVLSSANSGAANTNQHEKRQRYLGIAGVRPIQQMMSNIVFSRRQQDQITRGVRASFAARNYMMQLVIVGIVFGTTTVPGSCYQQIVDFGVVHGEGLLV